MKIRLTFELRLERAAKPEPYVEHREVDLPGTLAERMPEPWTDEASARRIGFTPTATRSSYPEEKK